MKASKSLLLPIAFALTAGAAFAEGPLEGNEVFNFQSTLSRADVQAQVAPAYKADQIARGEANPAQAQATVVASQLSRAQVLAEAEQRSAHLADAMAGQVEGLRAGGRGLLLQSRGRLCCCHVRVQLVWLQRWSYEPRCNFA